MTKIELLALAESLRIEGDKTLLFRHDHDDGAEEFGLMLKSAALILLKLAALEPVAWSTTRAKDGKKTLEFGACLPTNPAYTKAHNEWDWTGLYNLTWIIDHE